MYTNRQVERHDSEFFFAQTPVFTLTQFAAALGITPPRARERVKYHLERGRLRNVERGLYAVVPVGQSAERFEPDRYLVAATARPDAIFAHHAALELQGFAHSDWSVCTVFTARRRRSLVLGTMEVRFVGHPSVLARGRHEQLATRHVERHGRTLLVTGPERTLVEGFRDPREVGGLSELVESAAGFGVLDLDLVARVLDAYGQRSLWAAVGWFLETYRETFFVPDDFLERLESHKPRSPQYLPRGLGKGVLASRWNLVLPANVVGGREPDELE